MKLGTFIKQSLLCFLTLFILKFIMPQSNLLLYYCGLWGVYRTICEEYASLEDVPIFFLGMLFVFSSLLALIVSWSVIDNILVFRWILLDMMLAAIPWFIAVHSGQGLYKKWFKQS